MKQRDPAAEAAGVALVRAFAKPHVRVGCALIMCGLAVSPRTVDAATYAVGPGKTYTQLSQVVNLLNPGDLVTVDGNASYTGGVRFTRAGTAAAPITIRGIRVAGTRPRVSGGTNTVELAANNYVFEGFDVSGGSSRCVYHHAHNITIRDSVVHDCPNQGIISSDQDSGSLTVEYVEVTSSGSGTQAHPLYIETDEVNYPGSVFRLQYSYIHDNIGGNAVKSRAERNEIYYNWIDASLYRCLELIGAEVGIPGQTSQLRREDSDVVGNVLRQPRSNAVVRLGGDKDEADTSGRYRFVNNTIVTSGSVPVFQLYLRLQSLEMHNNVIYRTDGGARVVDDADALWVSGRVIGGANNWVQTSATQVPSEITATVVGSSPGFADLSALDFRLSSSSALINRGVSPTPGLPNYPFPSPLAVPAMQPPLHALQAVGSAIARPSAGAIDIGAYELGGASAAPVPSAPTGLTAQ